MKKLFLIAFSAMLAIVALAQNLSLRFSKAVIEAKVGEGQHEAILKQIAAAKVQLQYQIDAKAQMLGTEATLNWEVLQGGKVLSSTKGLPAKIQPKGGTMDAYKSGLEESMISTWEKQGFIRRQIGRIEKENESGTLGQPGKPGEKQGFVRRQIGRIPKQDYEVRVTLVPSSKTGNTTQPASLTVKIN